MFDNLYIFIIILILFQIKIFFKNTFFFVILIEKNKI